MAQGVAMLDSRCPSISTASIGAGEAFNAGICWQQLSFPLLLLLVAAVAATAVATGGGFTLYRWAWFPDRRGLQHEDRIANSHANCTSLHEHCCNSAMSTAAMKHSTRWQTVQAHRQYVKVTSRKM